MSMGIVVYLLIAFQISLVLCRPQSQNFNGSNPYYDSYGQNQYWGNNGNLNSYPTTQKSLYPTLFPQNTTPQPYYAKGQHTQNPQSNYFNRNSTFQNPSNTYGNNNFSSSGWNNNFNPYTTPSSTYQPYSPFGTATLKPPTATLPPFSPTSGSFNRYNQTNPTYPASNHQYNNNPTNPTTSNYRPRPGFPNNPTYPESNRTSPTYPNNHYNNNPTNPTYPPYRPQNTLPPYTPSPNPSSNYRPQTSFTNNPTYPASNRTNPTYPNNHYNNNPTNPTKTNNFQNYDRNDNRYNPQYRPSAPSVMPSQPTYDPHGTPLAPFESFHGNKPINDNLFNYDNLYRRQPGYNGMQSGQFEQLNQVPLAPFPGQRAPDYDSGSNVPLAPFPG